MDQLDQLDQRYRLILVDLQVHCLLLHQLALLGQPGQGDLLVQLAQILLVNPMVLEVLKDLPVH